MFVYMIVNQENGKIYIGKTVTKDLQKYLRGKLADARTYKGNSHLFNAMNKYLPFVWRIFPLISTLATNKDLCFWERVLIAQYDSQNPDIGYNICKGGEGRSGPLTPAQAAAFREGMMKTWTDPEKRAKRLANMKAAQSDPQRRVEIGKASARAWSIPSSSMLAHLDDLKVRALDLEARARVSEAGRKRWAKYEMVGKVFGGLTIQSEAGRDKNKQRLWNCLCVCGSTAVVTTNQLTTGNNRSCGCGRVLG